MQAKEIYDLLRAAGMTRAGALGMMGNMMAESSLKANIAQRGMTKLSDAEYTAAADSGKIDFVHDSVGYGLCQWTFWTRKKALLEFAQYHGASVGDGEMQMQFLVDELMTEYPAVYKVLCSSDIIDECADIVCTKYERPAVNNLDVRRGFARKFEAEIQDKPKHKDPIQATFPPDPSVKQIQYVMFDNGYWPVEKINGYKSAEFFDKLYEFVNDMQKC